MRRKKGRVFYTQGPKGTNLKRKKSFFDQGDNLSPKGNIIADYCGYPFARQQHCGPKGAASAALRGEL